MNKLTRYLAPALLLAAAACATAPAPGTFRADPEFLTADGAADFNPSDLGASRAAAVKDAERAAVRRAAELYMDDTARAENYAALENGPLKDFHSYVDKHKVLAEGQDGAVYRVSARVWVHHARLASVLRTLNLAGGGGRAAQAAFAQKGAPSQPFARAFREAFNRRSSAAVKDYPFTADQTLASGPLEPLLAAASAAGADLLVRASASAAPAGAGINTGFYPSRADSSAEVYETATGRQLLAVSMQADAIDSTEAASLAKALASAGELLGQEAGTRTARSLKADTVIRLRVLGVAGLEQLEKLKAQLQRVDLKSLRLEKYSAGAAVFAAVPERADSQELASAVLRGDSFGMELEAAGPQEIVFSLPR
jgi:hypothetical protein